MLRISNSLILFICLLLLPLFFFGGPDYYSSDSFKYAWNFGHPLFFFCANYLLLGSLITNKNKSHINAYLIAALFTLLTGISTELIQAKFSREPSIDDLYRNFLGLAIAIFWFFPPKNIIIIWTGRVISACGLLHMLALVTMLAASEQQRRNNMPILFNFEKIQALQQLGGSANRALTKKYASEGNSSLEIQLSSQPFSGISLKKMPGNWSEYTHFSMDVFNPSNTSILVTIRVDDFQHSRNPKGYSDRFNQRIELVPGWNHWSIALTEIANRPQQRLLSLSNISSIGLFSSGLAEPQSIYLDNVRLH